MTYRQRDELHPQPGGKQSAAATAGSGVGASPTLLLALPAELIYKINFIHYSRREKKRIKSWASPWSPRPHDVPQCGNSKILKNTVSKQRMLSSFVDSQDDKRVNKSIILGYNGNNLILMSHDE